MELNPTAQRHLVASLVARKPFSQTCAAVDVIETHISWVLLCGEFAYKIKKAVNLGFLDFSTLAKRRQYCHEELRLNRRLAPQLYLDVIAIGGDIAQPVLDTHGETIEYAVRMARFDQAGLLDHMLRAGQLNDAHVDRLAALVADFHARIPNRPPQPPMGSPEQVRAPVRDNIRALRERIQAPHLLQTISRIEQWTEQAFENLRTALERRRAQGFVRECHGDMHLGNMAVHHGELIIFDGIEFNPSLYWIDVMSEAAFVFMDLDDHGHCELAWRFLNQYLAHTGDCEGMRVLRYYLCYRAMVRAKVAAIQAGQSHTGTDAVNEYVNLAQRYARPQRPVLAIAHGLSGSGKSTVCGPLAQRFGALHLRSDRERQRLYGRGQGDGVGAGSYGAEATERTYARLEACAEAALAARFSVLVDATFLDAARRGRFAALAREANADFYILHFQAKPERLRQRVQARQRSGQDLSEADLAVLEHQLRVYEPLHPDESGAVIEVDSDSADADVLARRVAARLTAET